MRGSRVLGAVLAISVLLVPAGVAAAGPASVAAADGRTAADDFYLPPDPLPAGAPGDIIRAEPGIAGPDSAQALGDAWRVMYLYTDALGEPNAVTGTVIVPTGQDPATVPVVGLAPGTHGPAAHCAPSRMIATKAYYEQPAVNEMLRAGYAVMVTDYEGYHEDPKTTYVAGRAMGHALIDGVRAAQGLPDAGLSADAPVVFRGYSQGGGAAMWAGELQPEYAPELALVGVVGGGVPGDLVQVSLQLEGRAGFGLLAYSLLGLENAYPELDFTGTLNDRGRALYETMTRNDCTLELLLDYQGMRIQDISERSPLVDPEWLARLAENKLGTTPIEVPVLQYHATQDELVAFPQARALRQSYCDQGVDVTWLTQERGHIGMVYHGNADAMEFIAGRLAGEAPSSNC